MPESPAPRPLIRVGLRAFLDIERADVLWLVLLVAGSFLLRFASPIFPDVLSHPLQGAPVTAWGVGYPYNASGCVKDVPRSAHGPLRQECGFVFDEVYYPPEAAKDLHQPPVSYFMDHPPLGKTLIAPPIALLGFNPWSWRLSTTIFGSLLAGLVYLIARRLRRDRFFAVCAGLFITLDGLAFVESRTGLIDIIAIFFVALIYYTFLLHWQARTSGQWRSTLYVLATAVALAFATKLTAPAPIAVVIALIGLRWLEPAVRRLPLAGRIAAPDRGEALLWREAAGRRAALHTVAAAGVAALVFGACYSRYLTIEHDDVYRFTSCSPSTGVNAPSPTPMPPATAHLGRITVVNPVQAVRNISDIVGAGLQYHETECRDHPYASRWYSWPIAVHPVLFYLSNHETTAGGQPAISSISNMGNPALWWLALAGLAFCIWRMTRGPLAWRIAVPAVGGLGLAAMVVLFRAAQVPESVSVRVSPNPLFYAAFAGVILVAGAAALSAVLSRRFVPGLLVLGWLTAWMMWVPGNERRVLFYYHALGMLPFTALALAYALTALRRVGFSAGRWEISLAPVAHGAAAAVAAAFVFFYPIWTGAPLTQADHAMRTWVDTW